MNRMSIVPFTVLTISAAGCTTYRVESTGCHPANAKVTINHAADRINVSKEPVGVCAGGTLTFNIVPSVNANQGRVDQPTGTPQWIRGPSQDGNKITIAVPATLQPGDEFKYNVVLDGIGSLDPHATVRR